MFNTTIELPHDVIRLAKAQKLTTQVFITKVLKQYCDLHPPATKVFRVSDETYELVKQTALKEGVSIREFVESAINKNK